MNGVDRSGARRLMRIGQAAAVLLVGGAVLAMMVQPGLPAAPAVIASSEPDPVPRGPARVAPEFDVAMVANVLNDAGGVVPRFRDDAPPEIEQTDTTPIVDPIDPKATSNFRFLGGFFSPKRSLAIIAGGGKQRMVREGDDIDFGFTVNSISPDMVEIERNGVVEQLEREIASGAVVGKSAPNPAVATPTERISSETNVSESARDRLRKAREQAAQRAGADRAKSRADYQRQRQERLEELREQGIDVDELHWPQDD